MISGPFRTTCPTSWPGDRTDAQAGRLLRPAVAAIGFVSCRLFAFGGHGELDVFGQLLRGGDAVAGGCLSACGWVAAVPATRRPAARTAVAAAPTTAHCRLELSRGIRCRGREIGV